MFVPEPFEPYAGFDDMLKVGYELSSGSGQQNQVFFFAVQVTKKSMPYFEKQHIALRDPFAYQTFQAFQLLRAMELPMQYASFLSTTRTIAVPMRR